MVDTTPNDVCYRCGNPLSGDATKCRTCGAPQHRETRAAQSVRVNAEALAPIENTVPYPPRLFAVPVHKFVVLSLCTFGAYSYWWTYSNWMALQRRDGLKLSAFWRMVFSNLWNFDLLPRLHRVAEQEGVAVKWQPGPLALLYLLLSVAWHLPDPWSLLNLVAPMSLLPVVATINALPSSGNFARGYSGRDLLVILIGGLLLACSVYFAFAEPSFGLLS